MMNKKLSLSILWHQHQPYYKDDTDNVYLMPWVFLHAIKDYYEMARHVEISANAKVTFNLVPSLLAQLKDYTNTAVRDKFLMLLRKNVTSLTSFERLEVINQCFMANTETMIKPLHRYYNFYEMQSKHNGDMSIFSSEDILDLEILYLLAWCGVYIRREDNFIAKLLNKESRYTEEDKLLLLDRLAFWVNEVLVIHKRLSDSGRIELTTTPFYHPITPLLIDINSAYESFQGVAIPAVDNDMFADAVQQLIDGVDEFNDIFKFKPIGLWPAEGSISQKAIELWCENGIRFVASDEEVLANSLKSNLKNSSERHRLYMRRFQVHNGKKINIFFRDKMLSDLIGFTYSSWNPNDAVNDFIYHLRQIYDSVDFSPHVSVILDGENAWEYYKNNAFEFFTLLYKRLSEESWLSLDKFSDVVNNNDLPEEIVPTIQAGSWIMGNFKIWIGHSEKNKAWELISKTRKVLFANISKADEETRKQIFKELYIAEGSDWFWWFGDDHFTMQADLFDKLFRTHLINIYKLLKLNVPHELYIAIKSSKTIGSIRKPTYFISPTIDGNISSYYEWLSAGEHDLKSDATSMHAGGDDLKKVFYGFDDNFIYLRLDNDFTETDGLILELNFSADGNVYTYDIHLGDKYISTKNGITAAVGKILEIKVDSKNMKKHNSKLYLQFVLKKDKLVIEKAPLYERVEINIAETFANEWII